MMPTLTTAEKEFSLLEEMTIKVETSALCFPREVAVDLGVTARGEQVAGWAAGLGRAALTPFRADIKYMRPLMAHVKSCGFEDGFDTISGNEPSIANVGRLACQYAAEDRNFAIASEDLGEGPLSPTMEQLCDAASWTLISARDAFYRLGLEDYLS